MNELHFLISYTVFIGFLLVMLGLGAPTFLSAEAQQKLASLHVASDRPAWYTVCDYFLCQIINPLVGFFAGVGDALVTLYVLFAFNSTIAIVTGIIVTPYLVGLLYVIIGILRGGK